MILKSDSCTLFKDSLLFMRARHNKSWWGLFVMADLSLQIAHECEGSWQLLGPDGSCVKCNISFKFEDHNRGGYSVDYISRAEFNHTTLYKSLQYNLLPGRIPIEDPLVEKVISQDVMGVEYTYTKYKAGISLIMHGLKGHNNAHVSAVFLNKGGDNLVETKAGKCKICRTDCRGAEMRGFLVLQGNID